LNVVTASVPARRARVDCYDQLILTGAHAESRGDLQRASRSCSRGPGVPDAHAYALGWRCVEKLRVSRESEVAANDAAGRRGYQRLTSLARCGKPIRLSLATAGELLGLGPSSESDECQNQRGPYCLFH
jgi:hypothetical protein